MRFPDLSVWLEGSISSALTLREFILKKIHPCKNNLNSRFLNSIEWFNHWFYSILFDYMRFSLILFDPIWFYLIRLDSIWFYLILIDSSWFGFILIDSSWFYLVPFYYIWFYVILYYTIRAKRKESFEPMRGLNTILYIILYARSAKNHLSLFEAWIQYYILYYMGEAQRKCWAYLRHEYNTIYYRSAKKVLSLFEAPGPRAPGPRGHGTTGPRSPEIRGWVTNARS